MVLRSLTINVKGNYINGIKVASLIGVQRRRKRNFSVLVDQSKGYVQVREISLSISIDNSYG